LNGDVAWKLTAMNVQALAITGLATRIGTKGIVRERPSVPECRADPHYGVCTGGDNASFPSGHTAGAFTAAGLACIHHQYLPLYGGGVPDALGCIVPVTLATGDGVMRILADRHWSTDVIAGALFGYAVGYLTPYFLHYRAHRYFERDPDQRVVLHWALAPLATDGAYGAQAFGQF
jgi:membrane-associated phospholipid phosphatase